MHRFVEPPVFVSEEQTHRARLFQTIACTTMPVATLFMLITLTVLPQSISRALTIMGILNILGKNGDRLRIH